MLWPDSATGATIRQLWTLLSDHGLPSMATHTHRLHRPHVSLIVAADLPAVEVLTALGPLPSEPIPLRIEAAGVFPEGFLFLVCVANVALVAEQRRVHEATEKLAVEPWPYFQPGTWTPHITTGWALNNEQLFASLPFVLEALPIHGWLDQGGVEDGTTGEKWCAPV